MPDSYRELPEPERIGYVPCSLCEDKGDYSTHPPDELVYGLICLPCFKAKMREIESEITRALRDAEINGKGDRTTAIRKDRQAIREDAKRAIARVEVILRARGATA